MNYRRLGKTGFEVSELSLGTWQVGGKWGTSFNFDLAGQILKKALDSGINFIDTADVYSNGDSERAVGKILKQTRERVYVATKCGRQINPHIHEGYTPQVLRKYVEDSLGRLGVECIDLIQLHCPPTEVYYRPEIFGEFEKLKKEGKILNLGVSVEKVEEGIKAITYDNVTTIQIIYNMFRQRPNDLLFRLAQEKDVGLIVRVPLASGLLTGKFTAETHFDKDDHRAFNRNGEVFDKGETFSGIPYQVGLHAVERLKSLVSEKMDLAQFALKWILMNERIGCVIPGASSPTQVSNNLLAPGLPNIPSEILQQIDTIYREEIQEHVHHRW